jgi:hypothetical protein
MKLIPLPLEVRALTGASHKVIVDYTDISAAALTKTIQLIPDLSPADNLGLPVSTNFSLPAGTEIRDAGWMLITPFTGGVVSSLVVDIGIGGTATKFVANATTDLFTALATNTKGCGRTNVTYTFTQADVITGTVCAMVALFTAVGANLSALTAGQMEIYFALNRVNLLATIGEPG